jgi:hypothetical protein
LKSFCLRKQNIYSSEKENENAILDYLALNGWFCMKNHQGGKPLFINKQFKKMIPFMNRYSRKGVSDIIAVKNGRFLAVEVKEIKEYFFIKKNYKRLWDGKFNPENKKYLHFQRQIIFIEDIKKHKGIGLFASSIDDLKGIA